MNKYQIETGPDGIYWVTLQPLMTDVQASIEKLMKIDANTLTERDKQLLDLKILGLHTVHNFLGSLVTEQYLKEQRDIYEKSN